jgi:hypothetical protein
MTASDIIGPISVTERSGNYTSSMLNRFAWSEDPQGTAGLLFVEFDSGDEYVYYGVPRNLYTELKERAEHPDADREDDSTVGEFFHREIRQEFDKRDSYDAFDAIIN